MKRSTRSAHLSRLLIVFSLLLTVQSCLIGRGRDNRGDLVSYERRKGGWSMQVPPGMVLIPGGAFIMGPAGPSVTATPNPSRRATVESFCMKETLTTNGEYLIKLSEFMDSAARVSNENEEAEEEDADPSVVSDSSSGGQGDGSPTMLSGEGLVDALYPDRQVWKKDLKHEMADHMVDNYLPTQEEFINSSLDDIASHLYANYPVVGLTAKQCEQFLALLSEEKAEYNRERGLPQVPAYRLPSAEQYTYAARGGRELAQFPWGGPYLRNAKGELLANFKSNRGDYGECGYVFTSPVGAFLPNNYGLYDMAGNVACWTSTRWDPKDAKCPWRVIMGGSWKDIGALLQTGEPDYELETDARSYVGLQPVMPYVGAADY
ncbi:MAG: SUMF1/EgtB/PvdO family nonheme iron enzyme [Roseivirga sp.]